MGRISEEAKQAIVVTQDVAGCARLIDGLAAAGYEVTVRRELDSAFSAPTAVVCLETRLWAEAGRLLDDLGSQSWQIRSGPSAGLLLLYDQGGQDAGVPDDAFRRSVRMIASSLAPAARVNAIVTDGATDGVEAAVRLILDSPSMTGQTLRLSRETVPGVRPSLEGMAPPAGLSGGRGTGIRRMFIRDLVLSAFIGVHRHEKAGRQRVRLNVDLDVLEDGLATGDRLADVVCYETVAEQIRTATCSGHVNLVETLAERVAQICLADPRVVLARVRIEKLDIFSDAVSAGIEIERRQAVP